MAGFILCIYAMKGMTKLQEKRYMLMISLFWFAQYIYIPYQTSYLNEIGVASKTVGIIVGAYGIAQLLLRLPVGIMADLVGCHKKLIMLGTFASGLASLFRFFQPNEVGFLLGNIVSGVASAMWISFMVYYINSLGKEVEAVGTCKIVLFNNAGMLLGFLTSTALYEIVGMKVLCLFSVLGGILALLLSLTIKESKHITKKVDVKCLIWGCKNSRLLLFSIVALIQQGIQLATTMSFTTQILKNMGASAFVVGLASLIYMISAVCFAKFASCQVCIKRGAKFWIPVVFLVVAVYCLLVPRVESIVLIFILQILPGMSTGILFSYTTAEAMKEIPPEKKSTAMGLFQAIYAVGMTIFPIFTGSIAEITSMKSAYSMLGIIAIGGSLLVMTFYFRENKTRTYMEKF